MKPETIQSVDATKPDQRNSPRTATPSFEIQCENQFYSVEDWGLGGCKIANYEGQLRPGGTVPIELFVLGCHEFDGLPIEAEVLRFEPGENNALALKFDGLTAQTIMAYCDGIEERLGIQDRGPED